MSIFRKVVQIVFSILSIIAIVCSISILTPIPYLTRFIVENILMNESLNLSLIILLALIGLYFLYSLFEAIFSRKLYNYIELEKAKGTITITDDAIISTAKASIEAMPEVLDSTIKARLYKNPEDTKVEAHVKILETQDILSLTEIIQSKVKTAISSTLGVEVDKVDVKVDRISEEKLEEAKRNKKGTRPRVV